MRTFRNASLVSLLVFAIACPAIAAEQARVTILHTTDLHGALTSWDYAAGRASNRGLVKLATLIRAARAGDVPTILLDAGDAIEGGVEAAYRMGPQRRPDPMITAMNALGYDAMVAGNHEFDYGWNMLERARKASRFPWLGANVVRARGGRSLLVPSIVKQAGPLRIGVIGICTPAVPLFMDTTNVKGVRFDDPVAAARRESDRLRTVERCDAVVLVAHTGLERDPVTGIERRGDTPDENWGHRLATQVPGIDVLVLGHSHAVIPFARIQGVLMTQAGKSGEQLGRVELTFTREQEDGPWRISQNRGYMTAVVDTVADDPALASLARPWHDEALALLAQPVGRTGADLDAPRGRLANGPLWELIHRAQLAASGADVSLAALPDPTARIAAGPVTRGDLLRVYPYANTLGVVEMTGTELRETLEQSARAFHDYRYTAGSALFDPGFPGYNFDTASGVEYTIDLTHTAGERIVDLKFHGVPVEPAQRFKVVVNSYRMNGGGGFEAVRRARRLRSLDITVREAMASLLARAGSYVGTAPAAWTLRPDHAAHVERPLIDLLVRRGVLTPEAVLQLRSDEPATGGEIEEWIARAYSWRPASARTQTDMAQSWAAEAQRAGISVPNVVTRDAIAEACTRAALRSRYAGFETVSGELDQESIASFRRALGTGVSAIGAAPTRAQALGMISNARYPTIRVLETTDFHGAILPGAPRNNRSSGGSAVLAAWIEKLRAENPEGTVLIDGGDMFQGTMISNLQFGRPVVAQMNALGYAAAAVGNHEFDWGPDTLIQRAREMQFTVLSANMRDRKTGRLPTWVRSDTSFARRGARVSVLGLSYRNTPSVTLSKYVAHLEFLDDSTAAAAVVPRLRPVSDVVVGVGHVPAESDSNRKARGGDLTRVARIPGVDAWFGGHSHNLVLDNVGGVPIAIAGSHGGTLAVCDLVTDPVQRVVIERRTELRTTYADEVTADPAMLARVATWNAAVAPIADQRLGSNARRLTRNRGGESTLGNFVTDAIRVASGVDVALQNSGGLRADLAEGPVTKGTIYEVMPFDNRVFTLEISGADVKTAIEQGLRGERVTQVSGIKYTFDLAAPAGQRLRSLTLADGHPIDDQRIYKVACNDFMATGGDDYSVLSGGRNRLETDIRVRDAIEQFVMQLTRDGRPVDYQPEKRIEKVAPGGN